MAKPEDKKPEEEQPPKPVDPTEGQHIDLSLAPNIASGEYCNYTLVAHSPAEFILDFAQVFPGMPTNAVRARVIMAPVNIKALYMAMGSNIKKYEQRFGEIDTAGVNWAAIAALSTPTDPGQIN